MVTVCHNDSTGFVNAYVDYDIVDSLGVQDENGKYCFVREVWVHKTVQKRRMLQGFVMNEHKKFPQVKWLYFLRRKYKDRMSCHDIKKFYKREN